MAANGRASDSDLIVAFAGGGTGGHIYPALAVADALRERVANCHFLFFCTQRTVDERILCRADFKVVRQPLRSLSRNPWRWPGFLLSWRRAHEMCRGRIAASSPAVVLGTGGLASIPAIREAGRIGISTAVLNPDAKPGRANRYLAGRVGVVFAQWEETRRYLTDCDLEVTGCPVRPAFRSPDRLRGIERSGLSAQRRTLLVTGASQGAKSLNDAFIALACRLAAIEGWQILHLTGEADEERVTLAYRGCGVRAAVSAYTDEMADAMATADLVVSRAGASTLAEITALGRPSILLPYPYHRDQHQLENARCLARASAARIVTDRVDPRVNGPALWGALEQLMNDGELRERMGGAASRLGRVDAAARIADYVLQSARNCAGTTPRETVQAARGAAR